VNSIYKIIESTFQNNAKYAIRLLQACTKNQQAVTILTSHQQLTDEEIDASRILIDDFHEL
jgi:histidinol phosphatase-like PHP family hydrolase